MSLPSWLKNAMGSPDLARQQANQLGAQQSPFACPNVAVGQAIGVSPFNGDPTLQVAAAKAMMQGQLTGDVTQPRYRARVQISEVVSTNIAEKLVAALPPTAAIKISSVAIVHNGGLDPQVEIVFFSSPDLQARDPLTLPLTADFPSDADISRILLAMP